MQNCCLLGVPPRPAEGPVEVLSFPCDSDCARWNERLARQTRPRVASRQDRRDAGAGAGRARNRRPARAEGAGGGCGAADVLRQAAAAAPTSVQVSLMESGKLHEVPLQSGLQRLVAVDGNRQADRLAALAVDVMAAADSKQSPAAALQHACKRAACNRLHSANSSTCSPAPGDGGAISAPSQPAIASRTFATSSSI